MLMSSTTTTRLFSILLLLSGVFAGHAWIQQHLQHHQNSVSRRSVLHTTPMMASKGQAKWEKKKAWLEKRGYDSEGQLAISGGGGQAAAAAPSTVTVIGGGRIGSLLAKGGETVLLGRGDSIDPNDSGPIFIATRNDALEGIVDECPENRRKDLVFLQNGYLDKFLESKGLLDNTQVLLYLAVTSKDAEPIDGITSVNPEGLTAATGLHAQAFADRLASLNLKCNVVTPEQYRPAMFEKLIWISVYMLVGTAKECATVGQAGAEHGELVEQIVNELVAAVSEAEGITFPEGTMKRLAAYTDVVSNFPCGVKEFEWRNQYFHDLGDDKCPAHNALLRECAEKGFLSFELP